jgi:hypothetical protein
MSQNPTPNEPPKEVVAPQNSRLSRNLMERLLFARERRQNKFADFELWFKDREGIVEEGDTRGVGVPRASKGKDIHLPSTLNKIRAATAKVSDAHRANNRYPTEYLAETDAFKPLALTIRKVQDRCFDESGFWEVLDTTVLSGATYGTMLIGGPHPYEKEYVKINHAESKIVKDETGKPIEAIVVEDVVKGHLPRFEYVAPLNFTPDPRSTNAQDGLGWWEQNFRYPEDCEEYLDDPTYQYVAEVIKTSVGANPMPDDWSAEKLKSYREACYTEDGLIIEHYFAGSVPLDMFLEWKNPQLEKMNEEQRKPYAKLDPSDPMQRMVKVTATLLGGTVVRCELNTFPNQRRPMAHAVWERIENQFDGRSVAQNNSTFSKIQRAAIRMYFQSKALSMLAPRLINKSMFLPNQSFDLSPDTVLELQPWVMTLEASRAAYRQIEVNDVSQNWLEPYEMAEQWSDEATGIPKYAQGSTDAPHLNPTATGISLIMGAGFLPLKTVTQNVDRMLQDIGQAQLQWTVKYLKPEIVESWFGKEEADNWRIVQGMKSLSWLQFRAVGTENFMKKQVLFQRLGIIWNIAQSNPEVARVINWQKFFTILFESADLGIAPPVRSDEEVIQMQAQAMKMAADQREHESRLLAAKSQTELAKKELDVEGKIAVKEADLAAKELDKLSADAKSVAA